MRGNHLLCIIQHGVLGSHIACRLWYVEQRLL
jgi:hypothetical protein